jgi:trans-aconitate methyltransferase
MHHSPFHAASSLLNTTTNTTPKRILDVGCGTGIMTVSLAHKFPSAAIFGIDLSPAPLLHTKPHNVTFILGNIRDLISPKQDKETNKTKFTPGSVDCIYSRLLICGMTNWPTYIADVFSLLRPGGYAELHDFDYK